MAAAEYYGQGSMAQQGPPPAPAQPPMQPQRPAQPAANQRPTSRPSSNPPYPMSDTPPPPYQAFADSQRPQSQPPPHQRLPAQNGGPSHPPFNADTHQYPPEKTPQRPSTLQNMTRPSDFTASHPPPQQAYPPPPPHPPQQNGYPPQNGYAQSNYAPSMASAYFQPAGTGLSQVYNNQPRPPRRSSTSGYPTAQSPYRRSSRSRSRSRDRDRKDKHKHKQHARPGTERGKSSGVNTFLGAGGGAIIGDLIFPGLGTIGGAVLGGLGGHEYGKNGKKGGDKRATSNPNRPRDQRSKSAYADHYDDERRGRR